MIPITELQNYLVNNNFSQIFVLTDENTGKYCLPILLEKIDEISDRQATLLEIPSSEETKTMETAINLCNSLLDSKADRNSVIISLGGGVVTDMGAFVSSIYKRGIQNINVPTSLLAMIDASIGFKTGVNLHDVKNAVGTFNTNTLSFLDTDFLQTLPEEEMLNGVAEMLKTFLVMDEDFLREFISKQDFQTIEDEFILRCIELKENVVAKDLYDRKERKILNFGHTIGHALESLYLSQGKTTSHGKAIAIGMFCALLLSEKKYNVSHETFLPIYQFLNNHFPIPELNKELFENLIPYLYNDKKTLNSQMNFVLLKAVGTPQIDVKIMEEELLSVF